MDDEQLIPAAALNESIDRVQDCVENRVLIDANENSLMIVESQ